MSEEIGTMTTESGHKVSVTYVSVYRDIRQIRMTCSGTRGGVGLSNSDAAKLAELLQMATERGATKP